MSSQSENHDKEHQKDKKQSKEDDKKVDFMDELARRSAGLPSQTTPQREKSPWSYAGLGLQFAGTTALFVVMGLYLDHRFGWSPWGTVGLTMLGLVGGLYLLIKDSLKQNRDQDRKT